LGKYIFASDTHTHSGRRKAFRKACSGGTAGVVGASAKLPGFDDQIC